MLAPGTILQNRYRVVRQLGQGGMGTVYEAVDVRLDASVALKETRFSGDELRRQFEREARLLARLHHPALPRVSDHFAEGGGQFLVMQFVEGEDLEDLRRRGGGRLPPGDVLRWADQLLDALDYLHAQQPAVVHRDIKPQNLKLTGRGQIILLDFGLAKGYAGAMTTNVTLAKSFFGFTPMYAPLEQIQGTGTDPRSDLYSLAATLYHLMTGVPPPDAISRVTATTDGEEDLLLPAHRLNGRVPPMVSDILTKAMALARALRFASAREMREVLAQAISTPVGDAGLSDPEASRTTVVHPPPAGRTPPAETRGRWDEFSFFEEADRRLSRNELEGLRRLYEFSVTRARVTWGRGSQNGSFNVKFDHINNKSIYTVATDGTLYLNFAWLKGNEAGAEAARQLGLMLRGLPGFNIPADYPDKYVGVPAARWVGQVERFVEVVDAVTSANHAGRTKTLAEDETAVAPGGEPEGNHPPLETTIVGEDRGNSHDRRMPDEPSRLEGKGEGDTPEGIARIDEPVVAININQQYGHVESAEDLYNATRGIWRLDRRRAQRARYAFAVYQGVIREVYAIDKWMPASWETIKYWDERSRAQGKYFPPEVNEGRSEFIGEVATEVVRKKYVGRQMPKRHSQNPILYFNC